MGKLYTLFALTFLSVGSIVAQGTFQFTWHGDSNFFQANFEVTAAEMQPGAVFNSPLFFDSMAVTNPVGQWYHGGDSSSDGSGSYIPWNLSFLLNDFQRGTELVMAGGSSLNSPYRTAGIIWEQPVFGGGFLWSETGHWTVAQIPEPSTIALLCTGLTFALLSARKKD